MQPSLPLSGLAILVIEDSAAIAMDLSDGLRRAGARKIELKASAYQARKRLASLPAPDIVLLDNALIGAETGTDLALWMREQPQLQNTLRISYSGSDPAAIRARLPDDQVFHALIVKPLPLAALVQQLALLLQQRQDRDNAVATQD